MTTDDEKKLYYEYNPEKGGKWWNKETPVAEPWFQAELNAFAGLDDGKHPRLLLVWGGDRRHDYTVEPQLKYQRVVGIVTGYDYIRTDGTVGYIKSMNLAKDAKEPWEFVPHKERLQLGRLRWIIERHVSAAELRKQGCFTKLHDENGKQILRELPAEGVYHHFFTIQTAAYRYREPDAQVLTAVKAMWKHDLKAMEAQAGLDMIEQHNQQTLIQGDEARRIFSRL